MTETGPTYGVELIGSLPLKDTDGVLQALPGCRELSRANDQGFERVVAGYEVLLWHWRDRGKEIERLWEIINRTGHPCKWHAAGNRPCTSPKDKQGQGDYGECHIHRKPVHSDEPCDDDFCGLYEAR